MTTKEPIVITKNTVTKLTKKIWDTPHVYVLDRGYVAGGSGGSVNESTALTLNNGLHRGIGYPGIVVYKVGHTSKTELSWTQAHVS